MSAVAVVAVTLPQHAFPIESSILRCAELHADLDVDGWLFHIVALVGLTFVMPYIRVID